MGKRAICSGCGKVTHEGSFCRQCSARRRAAGLRKVLANPARVERWASLAPPPHVWRRLRQQVAESTGWTCALCGETVTAAELEVDHIVPLSLGGTNELWNLRPLHRGCHRRRKAFEGEQAMWTMRKMRWGGRRGREEGR